MTYAKVTEERTTKNTKDTKKEGLKEFLRKF